MNNLDKIMQQKKIPTSWLSAKTKIPKQTLDSYRQNRRSMNLINGLKIAYALSISPFDLVSGWKIDEDEIKNS